MNVHTVKIHGENYAFTGDTTKVVYIGDILNIGISALVLVVFRSVFNLDHFVLVLLACQQSVLLFSICFHQGIADKRKFF